MILKYPADLDTQRNDYIQFSHFKYQINDELRSGLPPAEGNKIILYMPNTTPATEYGQSATYQTFPGPIGSMVKKAAIGLGGFDPRKADGSFDAFSLGKATGEVARSLITDADPGGMFQQGALDFIGGQLGFDAATAIAMGQGKAFNPNAELIYNQPLHRKFALTFNFVPKSPDDTRAIDAIIYEFKKWSAPSIQEGSQYMEIPHLWQMTYCEAGGGPYRRMNLFKPAMITNVGVQDNSNSNFHITIADGEGPVPVQTAIALTLQETMPPTRKDHDDALARGHRRGF